MPIAQQQRTPKGCQSVAIVVGSVLFIVTIATVVAVAVVGIVGSLSLLISSCHNCKLLFCWTTLNAFRRKSRLCCEKFFVFPLLFYFSGGSLHFAHVAGATWKANCNAPDFYCTEMTSAWICVGFSWEEEEVKGERHGKGVHRRTKFAGSQLSRQIQQRKQQHIQDGQLNVHKSVSGYVSVSNCVFVPVCVWLCVWGSECLSAVVTHAIGSTIVACWDAVKGTFKNWKCDNQKLRLWQVVKNLVLGSLGVLWQLLLLFIELPLCTPCPAKS